jgi:hypothetical protein
MSDCCIHVERVRARERESVCTYMSHCCIYVEREHIRLTVVIYVERERAQERVCVCRHSVTD